MYFKLFDKLLLTSFIFMLLVLVSEKSLMAEAVFLKDGSIINGNIISDAAGSLTLRLADKKTKQIPRSDIMRILYTELKMGKIYIQKRDGKGIVAYMVDEDRESYTFRLDLYKPEEFNLKRSAVLFIAEKNPSGLQTDGEIGTDRVSLLWEPPYDKVKNYNIYIKKNDKDKYELVESTGSKSAALKNLSSNTNYFIIVTSIDSDDYESPPSNELQVKTKNLAPSVPEGIVRDVKGNKIIVKWNESKDTDGKLKGYNIYNRDERDKGMIAAVKIPEYTLPENISIFKLEISSVDDLDMESSKVRVLVPLQLIVSAAPAMMVLAGDLGDMFKYGYGGVLNIGLRNIMLQDFEAGLSFSYFTLPGKEEMNTDRLNFIPVSVHAGYHLWMSNWFSFFPFMKIGVAYSIVTYTDLTGDTDKTITDPVAAAGLALTANTDNYTFSIGGDYGIIYESAGVKPFYEGFLSCGVMFEF